MLRENQFGESITKGFWHVPWARKGPWLGSLHFDCNSVTVAAARYEAKCIRSGPGFLSPDRSQQAYYYKHGLLPQWDQLRLESAGQS